MPPRPAGQRPAAAAPPGALASRPAAARAYLDWTRDAAAFLRGLQPFSDDFWEASHVAYCLCSVTRSVGAQLLAQPPAAALAPGTASQQQQPPTPGSLAADGAAAAGSPAGSARGPPLGADAAAAASAAERKALWELFAAWCDDGRPPEASEYGPRLSAGVSAALARLRDLDADGRAAVRAELRQLAEALDAAARAGMAALMEGPAFDADARRAQGPVLMWIDRLFRGAAAGAGGAGRPSLARGAYGEATGGGAGAARAHAGAVALGRLLSSNLEALPVCIDRCYHPEAAVAAGYFQVRGLACVRPFV